MFAFSNKTREAERLLALAKAAETAGPDAIKRSAELAARKDRMMKQTAWSVQKDRRERRDERREKRGRKKDWELRVKRGEAVDVKRVKGDKEDEKEDVEDRNGNGSESEQDEDMEKEYKAMMAEDKEEGSSRKIKGGGGNSGSMFDDMS